MKKEIKSSHAFQAKIPADPKRGRGRPKKGIDNQTAINNNILTPEVVDNTIFQDLMDINLKADFSEQELKFLEYYLPGGMKQEEAAKLAGYTSTCDRYLRKIAQKIVQKHEARTGDHRKIMRAMGFGEVKVIELMIEAATKFKSETVQQRARETLGKWLGMGREEIEGVEGVQIVIRPYKAPGEQTAVTARPQPRPTSSPDSSPKVRMIK